MQVNITPQEQATVKSLTAPKGRTLWFQENAGISWHQLQRLRTLGMGEEVVVKKTRAFLKRKDVKALMPQNKEAMAS